MSVDAKLRGLGRAARRRAVSIVLAFVLPLVAVAIVLGLRTVGTIGGVVAGLLVVAVGGALAVRAASAIDAARIARRIDTADPAFEDSADILFRDAALLSPLQRLQQRRIGRRLESGREIDIAAPWPWRSLAIVWLVALVAGAAVLASRPPSSVRDGSAGSSGERSAGEATRLDRVRLAIAAPAYTGIAARSESSLETRVPEGSRVDWQLRFTPRPDRATLVFHDGTRVALTAHGDEWTGGRVLATSVLYRVELAGAPPLDDDRLSRIDVIPDRAPDVRVIRPEKSLTLLAPDQASWDLAFEAGDDYGIASANLSVTLAQGSGENIAFREKTIPLTPVAAPDGTPAGPHLLTARYVQTLDLAALGIAEGDDVIVRLAVSDAREPEPNTTKSASFILRWPPQASSDSVGMEGIVEKTMPAYFRSQRQIIIDTETLIADAPKLDEDRVLARSDGIGVDQKILRLRYGQFLGEEFETASAASGGGGDGHAHEQAADAREDALRQHEHEHEHDEVAKFGEAGAVMTEFGHTHDNAEAATLLDPETKAILKSALDAMWQAELHLRQGHPREALPYENRALGYIKEVQQSSRIYLARVGLELPAVDESRRLSGDRKGVTDRTSALVPSVVDDSAALALWQALDARATPDFDAFERWVRTREGALPDALAVLAAADRVRRDPACAQCRQALRRLLWPLLPQPATGVAARVAPDTRGKAYLDALDRDVKASTPR